MLINKIKNNFLDKTFLLFVFAGVVGTLTNIVSSSTFSLFLDATLAYVLGYTVALCVTYVVNYKFVFSTKPSLIGFGKFVISYIPNFIILFTLVYVFINILHWNNFIVYGLVAIIALPITFLLVKLFAFKRKENNK
jgi:putative flippase GtrA